MAKKIFAQASLSKGKRWVIDFVSLTPAAEEKRHRRDFDLNEIADLSTREKVAKEIIRFIDTANHATLEMIRQLTAVQKSIPKDPEPVKETISLGEAVNAAFSKKLLLPRKNSHRGYKSIAKMFLAWADKEGLTEKPVTAFGRRHARAFIASLVKNRKYRGCTLNNYVTHCKGLFTEIEKDEWIKENVWKCIEPFRQEKKLRRAFTDEERRIVAAEIERTDYWMFRCVLLQFFCYVRPVELTRLRMRDFDLGRGVVTVQEGDAKSWKAVNKTIPKTILHYFRDGTFDKYPGNYYMLGLNENRRGMSYVEPGTKQVDDDRMYRRHLKVLNRLKKKGLLKDITGLTWYSWKDTGISRHVRRTNPVATKDQAGHSDLSMTSLYDHIPDVISEYQDLENDLFT